MIQSLEISQDVQNIIDYKYSVGILNYLHKIEIINVDQLQKLLTLQKSKLDLKTT